MPLTDRDPRPLTPLWTADAVASPELSRAFRQGLDLPVCALRASLKALCEDYPGDEEAGVLLRGAIEEVGRIEDNVRELVEFATPPVPQALETDAHEVVLTALRTLPLCQRARIRTCIESAGGALELDVPLLATALRRLVDNALEASPDDVLVVARVDAASAGLSIAVVNGATRACAPEWALAPFRTTKPGRLGLGLTLARRDVELLGGRLGFEPLAAGGTRATLRAPNASGRTHEEAA